MSHQRMGGHLAQRSNSVAEEELSEDVRVDVVVFVA